MSDTTVNLTHPHAGKCPEPYAIDITGAEPDGWFVLAVSVDDTTAERWGRIQQQWLGAQDEMERAFKAAQKIIEDQEAAEAAEAARLDAIEAAKEKARVDAIEAELTAKHGPRQWAIVEKTRSAGRRKRGHIKTRVIHNVACGTFGRLEEGFKQAGTSILLKRLRTPEAVEALNAEVQPYYGLVEVKPCGHCGAPLLDAKEAAERKEHERFMDRADAPDFV